MAFKEKYGPWALITGTSEGTGSAFAHNLADRSSKYSKPFLRRQAAMMSQVLPGASGTFVRDGKPKLMTIEALADIIAKPRGVSTLRRFA